MSLPCVESVTTCICRQDCVPVFQGEQLWAHLYHPCQWESDVILPADGTFSQSREQTPGYHFRSSISTWPIRVRSSQETPLGWSPTQLRRKLSCAVLRENHCCLFLRTACAITIWNRELDSAGLCCMPDLFPFFGLATQIWPSNKCLLKKNPALHDSWRLLTPEQGLSSKDEARDHVLEKKTRYGIAAH